MERKITLELVDKNHYWMKGIYLIRIGRLRYVGKALVVGNRVYQHQLEINRTMSNYAELVNMKDEWSRLGSYIRLAKYLHENPKITKGTVEVLERQICSNAMYHAENAYLKEILGNIDFYNCSHFGSRPKQDEDNLWDVEEKDGVLRFFDPRIKHIKVLSTYNSYQSKEVIKQINAEKESKSYKVARLAEKKDRMVKANPERKGEILTYILAEMQKVYKG